jgi:hypothetical protein
MYILLDVYIYVQIDIYIYFHVKIYTLIYIFTHVDGAFSQDCIMCVRYIYDKLSI